MNSHAIQLRNFYQSQFPWIWCNCLLRHNLIHSKILNLTKCREVLLKYSLLITHTGMPIEIWHQLWERLTDSFFQVINSLIESFGGKLDLPWLLTLDFVCLLFYLQYRPVQTEAPATGAANIGGLNFSCLFERAEIQIPVNKYECPQRLSFSPGNLFWGSFTNHNTGNYLRHGINITTNQRLSPTFRGNGNTIIVGDSQTSPLPIFPKGGGTSVHRLFRLCFSSLLRPADLPVYLWPWEINHQVPMPFNW